jgi:hypothetical protein
MDVLFWKDFDIEGYIINGQTKVALFEIFTKKWSLLLRILLQLRYVPLDLNIPNLRALT